LIRVGLLSDPDSPVTRLFPLLIFIVGLGICAFFRRSRLFFAMLALTLSQVMLVWVVPYLSADAGRVVANAIAVLLPLNLLALAFMNERGIVSPAGRRRLAILALEIIGICVLATPWIIRTGWTQYLDRSFISPIFSSWSGISQPALVAFLLATGVMVAILFRRYRAVESSLL